MVPLVIYDNECFVCVKFAKLVNFLARGRLFLVGHYTDMGKQIRDRFLDDTALDMFWFLEKETAYGGRAAIRPLFMALICMDNKNVQAKTLDDTFGIGCKSPKAVIMRSASIFTHSKKINLKNL